MNNVFIFVGYIIVALIIYFILVYNDLSIDSSHNVYNSSAADTPIIAMVALFWPASIAVLVCVFPFWVCYKLAFKLKEKLNPIEMNPNSLNKNKTYQSCG